ncbi:hypothetical protein QCA50_019518 [Cerrena zonata]|uniref:Uncharacterized protein n=1 Tax=Cerrena zonata TaxID=2478898 RepID=A0AAW0FC44_9APHY
MDEYREKFFSSDEGAPRAAVKRLTAQIEKQLTEVTINAPDWDTLYAARMARDLLWPGEEKINLDDFVIVSQTLVDLFCTPDLVPNLASIKHHLLTYYSLLQSTHMTNGVLSALPLPATLDPHRAVSLPSRLVTLFILVRDTLSSLIRLPFFLLPLAIHFPAYLFARYGAKLVEDEEETQAQNKIVFGLLFLLMIYPATFFFVWSFLRFTAVGAFVAVTFVFLFVMYHNKLINDNYEHAKRLAAAWRVLIGVWAPKKWDLSLNALSQYTTPQLPPENQWIDRSRVKSRSRSSTPAPSSSGPEKPLPNRKQTKSHKKTRPPSRRVIRHVLRARVEAVKSLESLFSQLDKHPDRRIRASSHLVRVFGGQLDSPETSLTVDATEGAAVIDEPIGWRSAKEVLVFLKQRGAKIGGLVRRVEGDWAAVSSEGEGTENEGSKEDLVWVPPNRE